MKLCLGARQERQYLDWADEIIFEYRDRNAIPDYIERYPGKIIILTCFWQDELDWEEIENYKILAQNNFLLAINQISIALECIDREVRFYLAYPINSYDELTAVLALGSEYVRLGAPLFFDMDNIKRTFPMAKIRLIPNIAYDDIYPRENGIAGTWVHPEDIKMYEPYVDILEFQDADVRKERALIRIYWEDREWPGDLQMLITNFNAPGVNRMIPSEVTEKRLNCRQVCKSHKSCHICYNATLLANPALLQEYKEEVIDKKEEPKSED